MKKRNQILYTFFAFISLIVTIVPVYADRGIEIVGSSTVYPFSTVVAERFSQIVGGKTPKIEATGSGAGIKLFCAGDGEGTIDITNSSRRMKASEQKICAQSGVKDIIEVKIGYDGIVIAQSLSSEKFELTPKEMFLALAKYVPNASGKLIRNPNETWNNVNSDLPNTQIILYGPPPSSGTRDSFVELVLEEGCQKFPSIKAIKEQDEKTFKAVCHGIREDGLFIEVGENDNLIVQKLHNEPRALGILGYSFLEQNSDRLRGIAISGIEPKFEYIISRKYPISRSLYLYVKKSHLEYKGNLSDFIDFFVSEDVMGEDGLLIDRGLIPLSIDEYHEVLSAVDDKIPMLQL